jgi:predicted membrane channel-forming protein YqfA (hemolysin III family)
MHLSDIITCAVIGTYVLLAIALRVKPNLPLIAAPLLLAIAGIALAVDNQDLADQLGFSVFYLLLGGAVLFVVEHVRDRQPGE